MARLFTAIDLPEWFFESVVSKQRGLPSANWEDQPHITLVHFGEVADDAVARVRQSVERVAFDGFELHPTGVGVFGEAASPDVMWIGVAESAPLRELHAALAELRSSFASSPEVRAFTPHITLARTTAVDPSHFEPYLEQLDLSDLRSFTVNEFHLYESVDYRYRCVGTISAAS